MPRSGRYALDTNVAIALLNGEPAVVARWQAADEVVLPAPVLGELLYGAMKSSRREENRGKVHGLTVDMDFRACDQPVCARYAALKTDIAGRGRPIPANDLWIAACCIEADAILVSRDAHFDVVPGLQREEW